MSNREYAIELISDETADDAYCVDLLTEYQNSPDKGDFVPFDEALKMCEIDINAIQK